MISLHVVPFLHCMFKGRLFFWSRKNCQHGEVSKGVHVCHHVFVFHPSTHFLPCCFVLFCFVVLSRFFSSCFVLPCLVVLSCCLVLSSCLVVLSSRLVLSSCSCLVVLSCLASFARMSSALISVSVHLYLCLCLDLLSFVFCFFLRIVFSLLILSHLCLSLLLVIALRWSCGGLVMDQDVFSIDACIHDPTQAACVNYTYPESKAVYDVETLCGSMSSMIGCSIYHACLEGQREDQGKTKSKSTQDQRPRQDKDKNRRSKRRPRRRQDQV